MNEVILFLEGGGAESGSSQSDADSAKQIDQQPNAQPQQTPNQMGVPPFMPMPGMPMPGFPGAFPPMMGMRPPPGMPGTTNTCIQL